MAKKNSSKKDNIGCHPRMFICPEFYPKSGLVWFDEVYNQIYMSLAAKPDHQRYGDARRMFFTAHLHDWDSEVGWEMMKMATPAYCDRKGRNTFIPVNYQMRKVIMSTFMDLITDQNGGYSSFTSYECKETLYNLINRMKEPACERHLYIEDPKNEHERIENPQLAKPRARIRYLSDKACHKLFRMMDAMKKTVEMGRIEIQTSNLDADPVLITLKNQYSYKNFAKNMPGLYIDPYNPPTPAWAPAMNRIATVNGEINDEIDIQEAKSKVLTQYQDSVGEDDQDLMKMTILDLINSRKTLIHENAQLREEVAALKANQKPKPTKEETPTPEMMAELKGVLSKWGINVFEC